MALAAFVQPDPRGGDRRFCYFAAAALLFVFSSSVYGQSTDDFLGGAVMGTVLDEFGQPVGRADVCTVEGQRSDLSIFCHVQTDAIGQFDLRPLPYKNLGVFARKIEDGFPAFDPTERAEIVNLTPENPLARVIINLGRRQGVVIPKVRDKVTGQVIRKFALRWQTYHEQGGWSGAADFNDLIRRTSLPVERNLRIEVGKRRNI